MTDLESRYRRLFAAYPPAHRAEREEEMVTTLLDVAEPGQTRPGARAAGSIVLNGLACRARSAPEWRHGLDLAGQIARALATTLAAAALGVGLLPPVGNPTRLRDRGVALEPAWFDVPAWTPVIVWALALLVILVGSPPSWGGRRHLPVLITAMSMAIAGPDLVGMRRSFIAPFVLLLALSTLDTTSSVRSRAASIVTGAAVGAWLTSLFVARWGAYDGQGPARLWMQSDRWYLASDLAPMRPGYWLVAMTVGLLAGLVRPRFAVAAGLLGTPLGLLTLGFANAGDLRRVSGPILAGTVILFATAAIRYRQSSDDRHGDAAIG
jgi:hypothetical protein